MGLITRTHGGAARPLSGSGSKAERSFFDKGIINVKEKRGIAQFAVTLIEEHETIFLNSGTTTLFFLEALDKQIRVITNNAAAIFSDKHDKIELIFLGGEYREQSRSFAGEFTLDNLRNVNSDTTVLSTNHADSQHRFLQNKALTRL